MRYPASYVLVHGDTEAEIIQQNGGVLPLGPTMLPSGATNGQQSSALPPEQLLKRATTGKGSLNYTFEIKAVLNTCSEVAVFCRLFVV